MRIALFAATPFQVFNCINIFLNLHKSEQADLFVLTFAVDMSEICKRLKDTKMFDNIFVLDKIDQMPGKKGVLKDFIFTDCQNKQMLMKYKYDIMYTTFIGDRNNLYYNILYRGNKNIKLYFYDEGIGVYTQGFYKSSNLMKKFYKLMRYKYSNDYFEGVYVYSPECVSVDLGVPIKEIPYIDKQDLEIVNKVNAVFGGDKSIYEKYEMYKVIYLDQDFGRYLSKEEEEKRYRFSHINFLYIICDKIKKESVLVKQHPIRKDNIYSEHGFNVEPRLDLPWEIIQMNADFTRKLLVGISSTALLTPKLIYDEEPYVIVLGKMIANEKLSDYVWTENIENLFKKVKEKYRNKEKFLIPNNINELQKYIQRLGV